MRISDWSSDVCSSDLIESALRAQNVELPAGRFESKDQNQTLRVERAFSTPEQFAQLVVGRGEDGYQVKLGDVARIEQGAENPYTSLRSNAATGVGVGITRQRSEEHRVGEEGVSTCRSRRARNNKKKK